MRVGTGWDLHKLEEGRRLVIGGVLIDSPKGCVAHSDGDVLIHAICDALLGACGLDDIGTLFPDTDISYKDISSSILLEKVVSLVATNGFHVENIDTTIILQTPKLGPYKNAIKENLADLLKIDVSKVGVKAKTAEGALGELGLGTAIIAQAAVLVSSCSLKL